MNYSNEIIILVVRKEELDKIFWTYHSYLILARIHQASVAQRKDAGPRGPGFETRLGQLVFLSSKEINRHC